MPRTPFPPPPPFSPLGIGLPAVPMVAPGWYDGFAPYVTGSTTTAGNATRVQAVPLFIPRHVRVSRLGIMVGNGAANFRMALYRPDPLTLLPNELVVESADLGVSTAPVMIRYVAISPTYLAPGLYHLAVSGSASAMQIAGSLRPHGQYVLTPTLATGTMPVHVYATWNYSTGRMPRPFTEGSACTAVATNPWRGMVYVDEVWDGY